MSVMVLGSANLDFVFQTPRLPRPGETILGDGLTSHQGGKGANQAVAIGRLGGAVAFVGAVGNDTLGARLRESLLSANVDIRWLMESEESTGSAGIFVSADAQNMIVVSPGANSSVTPEWAVEAIRSLAPTIVLAQLEIPIATVVAAARVANRFVLNPAPAVELPDELLQRCEVITPNESELAALTGMTTHDDVSYSAAARSLLERGVQNVVVTLGARGSLWVWDGGERWIAAPRVQAIDTTAAGDAFSGALAMFLAEGRSIESAIEIANIVGALSTTKPGAQESMPTRAELSKSIERSV